MVPQSRLPKNVQSAIYIMAHAVGVLDNLKKSQLAVSQGGHNLMSVPKSNYPRKSRVLRHLSVYVPTIRSFLQPS